ncbi:apolipoprotein N-acyltransferase [Umezawaea sp. Da 62-37]|uniref:apolipoprotein N-acyltransferase n=1 Tax=Umezawaea sp. Da 62-37 TaxID=3075927 RepID=UPI0028F6F705|nr:apolipoprotein N-acyltransferase [Umezawaea sp. Da 62-37]WNV86821.1 apolipoprotein N-acyltransferase [Umezawaea sp. Da 62-37]
MVATPVAAELPVADIPPSRRERDVRGFLLRVALSVAGGVLVYLSFPPRTVWWLAPLGFALLGWVLHGRRARAGFGFGVLFGLGFLVPLLAWTGEFVGAIAWLPLSLACAALIGLGTAAMAVVWKLPLAPLWGALLWVADEALRGVFPFGGFPWGKIAFGQPEGWYLPLAALGGAPLIGFAVVLTGFGAAAVARNFRDWPAALLVVVPLAAGLAANGVVGTDPSEGTAVVAAIQGNVPRAGLDFNSQRRAVLDNHVKRTEELAQDVANGKQEQPDLVIWPENSSDIDPFRNPDAAVRIQQAAEAIKAPIAVGAVVLGDDGLPRNTVILWDPVQGPIDQYTKRKLQPFGETMPYRSFFRIFTKLVDRANNFQPGTDPSGFTMGPAKVSLDTCYEVAFDEIVRENVKTGANLIAIPTNNATFGYTEMTYQQLSMSRVRAVEHGRAVVVAATSGVSAMVHPDGSVSQSTGMFTPAALVERLPLRGQTTLATRLGAWPEWVMSALGLLALAFCIAQTRRGARPEPDRGPGEEETDDGPAGAA